MQTVSTRADTGLPEPLDGFLFSDGTYWADGFTWFEERGSVLAGSQPVEGMGRTYERIRGRSGVQTWARRGGVMSGGKPSFSVRSSSNGIVD